MVNYKNKIEELKIKGIFTEEQAEKLTNSFQNNEKKELKSEKKYTLEMIGIGVMAVPLLYMMVAVNKMTKHVTIENVSKTLNESVSSGIDVNNSFIFIVLLVVTGLYLILYFMAQNRFIYLQKKYRKIETIKYNIKHTVLMEKELSSKLEGYVTAYRKHDVKKRENILAEIQLTEQNGVTQYLMYTYKEIQQRLKNERDSLAALELECRTLQDMFPHNLAKLIRQLPTCK